MNNQGNTIRMQPDQNPQVQLASMGLNKNLPNMDQFDLNTINSLSNN